MERTASAAWAGGEKDGVGSISTASGMLSNTRYGYQARFDEAPGSNPEELIAAAHAACFSMALAAQLDEAGIEAESISTNAVVTLEKMAGRISITEIHLDTVVSVPGDARCAAFETAAALARAKCPLLKLLKTRISLTTWLET